MAFCCTHRLSHIRITPCSSSPRSPCNFGLRKELSFAAKRSSSSPSLYSAQSVLPIRSSSCCFTWDDVLLHISQPPPDKYHSSHLQGFFEKIRICNRGSELKSQFIPFVIEDQIVGYIHGSFVDRLRKFQDVFTFPDDDTKYSTHFDDYVTLHAMLRTPEDRTTAVGSVVKCLGDELIPGIRNELYPVIPSFGKPVFFSLERAAAPYFGIKAYGVHMNGYVERKGQKFLWVAKRSLVKPTYPGMLDHLVAGGLPHGRACGEHLLKECGEEAGIPTYISNECIPVGAVAYMDIDGDRYKRDTLFCYDLKLPEDFMPINQDGEVESFKLLSVKHVADIICRTQFFKPNCCLVIIDFLVRHGYISPEELGYLELLQSLRHGVCS